jgi:pyrimidine-nucleoside phosphorylase
MSILDVIAHKRAGQSLTQTEIDFFVSGIAAGDIPDYQAAALLMAIYLRGRND